MGVESQWENNEHWALCKILKLSFPEQLKEDLTIAWPII